MSQDADLALENELRTREVVVKEEELKLKAREFARARWTGPLAVAIFAAAIAAFANAGLAIYKANRADKDITTKNSFDQALEDHKAETASMIEVLKFANDEKVLHGLQFLLDTHLIQNPEKVLLLRSYLTKTPVIVPIPVTSPMITGSPIDHCYGGYDGSTDTNDCGEPGHQKAATAACIYLGYRDIYKADGGTAPYSMAPYQGSAMHASRGGWYLLPSGQVFTSLRCKS